MSLLTRIFDKVTKRNLDAASVGRRLEKAGRINNLNSDIFHGAQTVRARAQYLARNNPHVAAGINALVGASVGTGLQPVPRHPDPAVRDLLSAAWRRWTDAADIAGRLDFEALQAIVARGVLEQGEAVVHLPVIDEGLRVRLLDPQQLPLDFHHNREGGTIIRAGVEFAADGRWSALHVYPMAPGDPLQLLPLTPVRIEADACCHVFEALAQGQQVRGLSRIAAVVLRALDLDGFEDATLMRQRIANLLSGFITSPDSSAFGETGKGGSLEWEPGCLTDLPPGAGIEWSEPPDAGANYADFVRSHLRAVASGLGCTYEAVSSDYSSTNYSSARAAMVDMRRTVEQFQHLTFVPLFLNRVWRRWVTVEVLRGTLPSTVLAEPGCDWLAPKWENPDPKASAETEEIELRNGLKSRTRAANERGIRVEDLDAEIAADRARESELGLTFGATTAPATSAAPESAP